MKKFIERLEFARLRNKTHFELMTEINGLITLLLNLAAMRIAEIVAIFRQALSEEETGVVQIRKYEETDEIARLDAERDNLLRGITETVRTALRHFSEPVRAAAARLKIVLDTYGNLAEMSYDDETAGITRLLQELESHTDDMTLTGVTAWVEELRLRNEEFRVLMNIRYTEEAQRVHLHMKSVRKRVDGAWHEMVQRLESGASFNGVEEYQTFFAEVNARIDRYKHILAQEKGRRTASNAKNE
jgi:hypothetical protein